MLLLMLGAVLLLIRQLEQPETVAYLDRVFSPPQNGAAERPPRRALPGELAQFGDSEQPPEAAEEATPPADGPWAAVEDNAMFLPAEQEAWFLLWNEVRRLTPAELDRQAIAEVSYIQLVNQPDVYRGQAVTVRGRVLRESAKRSAENELGITQYHELVLAPVGGGDWPVIVYCLDLPPGFPRGDGLREDVALSGLFFKNRSALHEDGGMGLYPVLLAKTFNWHPPAAPQPVQDPVNDVTHVWMGAVAAIVAAGGFVVWAVLQTRRPRRRAESSSPNFERLETES